MDTNMESNRTGIKKYSEEERSEEPIKMEKKSQNETTITITGNSLTLEDFIRVTRDHAKIVLSEEAKKRIQQSRATVEKLVNDNAVVYGLTTGFGSLAHVSIPKDQTEKLQENLLMSHAASTGKPLTESVVRGTMLLRVNTFAKGCSGIRLGTVELIVDMINKDVYPLVHEQGSVGASGDLAPLSTLFLLLMGKGEAFVKGKRVSGNEALKQEGIEPIKLTSKEGLALNNGTPVMTSIGLHALYDAEKVLKHSILSACMTNEALFAKSSFYYDKVQEVRPQLGQMIVARAMRAIHKGSELIDGNKTKVQDAYSLRGGAVVIGASLDALHYVKEKLCIEMNSATDNPLIFGDKAYSAANFHGQPIALAMDFLGIAMSEIANIADRRIARIVDPALNEGLPAFLTKDSGLHNGFMIPQYVTAALVSENKVLSHPSSVDSVPTCANQEDHVSMGTTAARHASMIIANTRKVIAIELMIAAQAVQMRKQKPGPIIQNVINKIRQHVDVLEQDRVLYLDIDVMEDVLQKNILVEELKQELYLEG